MQGDSDRQQKLFEGAGPEGTPSKPRGSAKPRILEPDRYQRRLLNIALDEVVAPDHPVRQVWRFVEGLDLSELYKAIDAVEGQAGRPAIDPRVLMALWLHATVEGIGSARALARLCEEHQVYQWICGGVSLNYHTLSDFRVKHTALLDKLLSRSVAVLEEQGILQMKRVAQDGMRVRASAGAASFRRRPTLEQRIKEIRKEVECLRREIDVDPGVVSRREKAARERSTRERENRVKAALVELQKVEETKKPDEKVKARASTSDPEARVMKMADGGFRPAYNVQLATDTATQVIVGVDVINTGSDMGQMGPMVEQLHERHGEYPSEILVDGGFTKKEDIEQLSAPDVDCTVYAPPSQPKTADRSPYTPHEYDSAAVAAWRIRMGTLEAKEIYKERAATAECVNAIARNRGLKQFLVRGIKKVKTIALWFALTHNMVRILALSPLAT